MPEWYQNIRSAVFLFQAMMGVLTIGYTLKKRPLFLLRLLASLIIGGWFCVLIQNVLYVPGSTPAALLSHATMSFVVYFTLIIVVLVCFTETIWTVLFVTASGYIAQDLAGSLKQLIKPIPSIAELAGNAFGILLVDLLCYGGVFLFLFVLFRPFIRDREEDFNNKIKAIFSILVLMICIGMARLTQDNPDRNTMAIIAESSYAIIVDTLILILQFGVMDQAKLKSHIEIMRELIHQQHMHYEASKVSAQLINEKYHDLKNMLNSFQEVVPQEQLDRMMKSIERYDIRVNTGNDVLDVLLTQKMDLCIQRNINLTCSLGGTDFSFVEEFDLYALFHNALDNAINAVMALPNERDRYIILSAKQDENIVTIHMENPSTGEITYNEGLPISHGDPKYHGFGMKSMLHTAERYHGTLAIKQENNLFMLDILLIKP